MEKLSDYHLSRLENKIPSKLLVLSLDSWAVVLQKSDTKETLKVIYENPIVQTALTVHVAKNTLINVN